MEYIRNEVKCLFGERLNEIIEQRGINKNKLAILLKLPQATINFWCNGKREPTANILMWVALNLNVTTDYLLGMDEIR